MKKYSVIPGFFRATVWLFLMAILPITSFSQQVLKIIDQETDAAIVGAAYTYSGQAGFSDANGQLKINYKQGESLYLSHVSYGQWSLTADEIRSGIEAGFVTRTALIVGLMPVNVLAIRKKSNEQQLLPIEKADALSHDAGQFLSRLPEFGGIRKSGSYGFDPVLRGFKYDQLNILVDGAQTTMAACPNRMDPAASQVVLNMMDQVEILKGPYSLRYGNSFGGVINFTSQPGVFTEQLDFGGRVSGGYEANGSILRSEGMFNISKKNVNLKFFGSYATGDDYTDGTGEKVPAGFKRGSVGSNLDFRINENQLLHVSATRNFARNTDFAALAMDLIRDDTWLLNARHTIDFHGEKLKSWNTTVYTSLVDHLMDNSLKEIVPRTMNAETPAKTQTYGGRTEGFFKLGKDLLFLGADFRQEKAQGSRSREFLSGPNQGKILIDKAWQDGQVSNAGLFAEFQLPMPVFTLFLSGRLDLNMASANDLSAEYTQIYPDANSTQLNPGFSAGAVRDMGKGYSLGLWLGRVQRSGSISERYINYFTVGLDPYEVVGNPQIKPEINNQADLVFTYKTLNTTVNLSLFGAYLQDMISAEINPALTKRLSTSPGVRQVSNIDEAFKTGFELSWIQKLGLGLQQQLAMAYTYGRNLVNDEPLPEIAPFDFRYSLAGNYFKNRLRPEILLRHVLAQKRISTVFGEKESAAFTLVDANVRYRINKFLNFSVGVNNLFDVAYYEHLNRSVSGNANQPIYSPGRNLFSSLTLNF